MARKEREGGSQNASKSKSSTKSGAPSPFALSLGAEREKKSGGSKSLGLDGLLALLAAARVDGVTDTDDYTYAHEDVDGNEVPEGSLVDDFIALVFVDSEGPDLSNDPPGEHEDKEEAENDGHEEGTASSFGLDTASLLDTDSASEGGDEREDKEDKLGNTTDKKPSVDGLLARRAIRVACLRAVDTEGNNEPDAHRQGNDRLHDRAANLKALKAHQTIANKQSNHKVSRLVVKIHGQGQKKPISSRAQLLFLENVAFSPPTSPTSLFFPSFLSHLVSLSSFQPSSSTISSSTRRPCVLFVQIKSSNRLSRFLRSPPIPSRSRTS